MATLTEPIQTGVGLADGVDHMVCCHDDDLSMCGLDLSDVPWGRTGDLCVVCDDLDLNEPKDACTCRCCIKKPPEERSEGFLRGKVRGGERTDRWP